MNQINTQKKTYLSFYLGTEIFGANVNYILEVLKDEHITEIPRSDDFIQGIINFRGEIVTVIDFQKKLNMQTKQSEKQNIIIVVELQYDNKVAMVGLLASKVRKVFEIDDNELKSVPEFGKYYNPEYLTGVAKMDESLIMLLDIEKILNEKDVQLIIETNKKEN